MHFDAFSSMKKTTFTLAYIYIYKNEQSSYASNVGTNNIP